MKEWHSFERIMGALISFNADNSTLFNSAEKLFVLASIIKKYHCHYIFKQTVQFVAPDCLCFSAVAFSAETKLTPRQSQNVNCFTIWVLGIHYKEILSIVYRNSLCLPSRITLNNKLYLFSHLSLSSTCYESFVDLQHNGRGRERVVGNNGSD